MSFWDRLFLTFLLCFGLIAIFFDELRYRYRLHRTPTTEGSSC